MSVKLVCGIAGIVSLNGRAISDIARRLSKMQDLLKHRGPDHSQYKIFDNVFLGFHIEKRLRKNDGREVYKTSFMEIRSTQSSHLLLFSINNMLDIYFNLDSNCKQF